MDGLPPSALLSPLPQSAAGEGEGQTVVTEDLTDGGVLNQATVISGKTDGSGVLSVGR